MLLYHSVDPRPQEWIESFNVTPDDFAEQMDLVVASGRRPVTLSELVSARLSGSVRGDEVVVTFDDGFAGLALHALPCLAERRLPSTAYITTGALRGGGRRQVRGPMLGAPMLAWSQLEELAGAGVEIGAHSVTHSHLDVLRPAEARYEMDASRASLEDYLSRPVASFAYPHGSAGPRETAMAEVAGFSSAAGVRNALSPPYDHPFLVARLTVRSTTTSSEVRSWLAATGAPVALPGQAWRTRAWRMVRRMSPRPPVGVLVDEVV